jgi:hypothetical protein
VVAVGARYCSALSPLPEGPRQVVDVPAGFTNVDRKGGGPMAAQPEGHQNTNKADRAYRVARWLGPIFTIYKIVREFLGL